VFTCFSSMCCWYGTKLNKVQPEPHPVHLPLVSNTCQMRVNQMAVFRSVSTCFFFAALRFEF
jgi:hypothetical protein